MQGKAVEFLVLVWTFFCVSALNAQGVEALKGREPGLYKELADLPPKEVRPQALSRVANLFLSSSQGGVKEAFQILVQGHNLSRLVKEGRSGARPSYVLPPYNTGLYLLTKLAEKDPLPAQDLLALSVAINQGFFFAFGDDEVKKAALEKCVAFLAFLREVDELRKQNGNTPLSQYPLEALLTLCRLWGTGFYGPSSPDARFLEENFSSFMKAKINLKRFHWSTIRMDLLQRLKVHFAALGVYGLSNRRAQQVVMDFVYKTGGSLYQYPAVAFLNPNTGVEYKVMSYDGVAAYNSNWHNPNYVLDQLLAGKNFYGWCTDVRQSVQFIAAALGVPALQTGWGVVKDGKEYSHYFTLFYLPEEKIWIRNPVDSVETPGDIPVPVFFKKAQLSQADYWSQESWDQNATDFYYQKSIQPSLLKSFYDTGVPTSLVKEITFQNKPLTVNSVQKHLVDTDGDGITDWMEAQQFQTDPRLWDSDGDGYSDGWEVRSGHNPRVSTPGNLTAVDGFPDKRTNDSPITDPRGDSTLPGSSDIRSLSGRMSQTHAFVSVQYHKPPKVDDIQTFHLRRTDGVHFWIQTQLGKWLEVREFRDGEDVALWKKMDIDTLPFEMAFKEVFEFSFPLRPLGITGDFQILTLTGGQAPGRSEWNVDQTEFLSLFPEHSALIVDGRGKDLEKKFPRPVLEDPTGDLAGALSGYDIQKVQGGIFEDYLYVLTTFAGGVKALKPAFFTLHLQIPSRQKNYWIQSLGNSLVYTGEFDDGQPFEEWQKIPEGDSRRSGVLFSCQEVLEVRIPLPFVGRERARFRVITGGFDSQGQIVWNADESDWFWVN